MQEREASEALSRTDVTAAITRINEQAVACQTQAVTSKGDAWQSARLAVDLLRQLETTAVSELERLTAHVVTIHEIRGHVRVLLDRAEHDYLGPEGTDAYTALRAWLGDRR